MFITQKLSTQLVMPFALVGALLFAGCSPTPSEAPATNDASEQVVESESSETEGLYDSTQAQLGAAPEDAKAVLTELSTKLDTIEGVNGVGVSYYGPEVDLGVVIPEAANSNITPAQLRAVLDIIAEFDYPATVEGFLINVWGADGYAGDSSVVGQELGLKDQFNDTEWGQVKFGVADIGSLYK